MSTGPANADDPHVVYSQTVDGGKFAVQVTRSGAHLGDLRIWDVRGDVPLLLHEQPTGLIADAIFGPDVSDVESWQTTALWHIDARLEEQPDT